MNGFVIMGEREVLEMSPQNVVGREECNDKILKVDVRDDDFGEGGIIKGAIHLPLMFINIETATELIKRAEEEKCSTILFYCKLGQQRSVKAAKTVNMVMSKQNPMPLIQIAYLKGGFNAFLKYYHGTDHVVKPQSE